MQLLDNGDSVKPLKRFQKVIASSYPIIREKSSPHSPIKLFLIRLVKICVLIVPSAAPQHLIRLSSCICLLVMWYHKNRPLSIYIPSRMIRPLKPHLVCKYLQKNEVTGLQLSQQITSPFGTFVLLPKMITPR